MPVDPVRDAAVTVLLRVFESGAFLDSALDRTLRRRTLSERGRRFLTQLVYGAVRHKFLCDFVLGPLLRRPIEELPAPIRVILRLGVFQALFCRQVTFPAMVHTSVDLAKRRGHAGTARLVNAVLKRTPQSLDEVRFPDPAADLPRYLTVRYSVPPWLVAQWIEEYGAEEARALCEASSEQAPVTLRTNRLRSSTDELCAGLTRAGYPCQKRTPVPEEVTALSGMPPARAKLFKQGRCILQDPASMLVSHLVDPQPGDRVLDLCAAPGVKTTHLSELAGGKARIFAMDINPQKLPLVRDNVARLQTPNVYILCGDGLRPPVREGFDRILVDAPCSGLGTLRRHPDLKWRMTGAEFEEFRALQEALLRSAIQVCKNGGIIVYAVCTLSRQETHQVAERIRETEPVEPEDGPDWLNPWKINPGQYRTLPHRDGLDGFFLTRLRKRS